MEWFDVLRRIQAGEDQHTQLCRWGATQEALWLKAACAFANTEGGLVVLGVTDDGAIDGVPMDPEKVQERLTNGLQNGASGPIQARVRRHLDPAGWVHWIEVARMRGPQPLRVEGRVLVRRHRSNADPDESELMELYNTFGVFFTEERLVPGTRAADIELDVFRAYMAARGIDLDATVGLPVEEELRRAEILGSDADGQLEATLYGLLCFGRSPQAHHVTRGVFVQLSAYAGVDRGAEVISAAEARGRVDEQVRRAEEWIRGLGRVERYEGMLREDRWVVPPRALREALVNAVAHRDYAILGSRVTVDVFDDRVEVTSPGALPNHKTPESVVGGGPPRSRNESIADFLLVQRLMEQRGTGFPRIRREMRAFNGTDPTLVANKEERWVRVTLWRSPAE
jgi:ATP-dependent DNA helicase RecG